MESNSDDDQGDASPSQQEESKPGGNTEERSMSIMSQIAKRQATQQAGSDQQQDTILSGWSSAIRGNIHDCQESSQYENIGDWREVHRESLIEEEENLDTTGDIYVIPPLKKAPPPLPVTASATDMDMPHEEGRDINIQTKEGGTGHIQGSTNIPSLEQGNTNIPPQGQGSTNIPSLEQESTNIPSLEQGSTNIPSLEQGSTNIPSQEQGSTNIPSLGSTNIPSQGQGITNIPSQGSTNIPSQEQGSTNIPSLEQGSTNIPSQGQGSTNIPSQGSTNIPLQGQESDNMPSQEQEITNIRSQAQEGDSTIAPLKEEGSTRISSLEDSPHVGGSTDVILKIDNQTLDVGNKSDGNINELASTETQDLELQTVTQLDDNRESETVPVVAKSTSDAKKDSSKDQTVYDIEGRTDVKTEETGRSQRKPPEVHPKQFKLRSEPFKFIVDGRSIQDQSRSEERAIPKETHVESQTSTDKSSSGVLHENRKSFKDILHQFEKPKPDHQQSKPVPQGRTSKSLSPGTEKKLSNTNQGKDITKIPRPEDTSKMPSPDSNISRTAKPVQQGRISKSLSPGTDNKLSYTNQGKDITTTPRPEDTSKSPSPRTAVPEKDAFPRKYDTDVAVGTPVKPKEGVDKDGDDEDDYETAEEDQEDQNEDDEEEETESVSGKIGGATVSTSQPHPKKLVDQLTPSQRTEFSDSHISVSSDASGGLGSDMVGNLIRTNIMSDSTASNISSIVPGIDQSLSHPTLQPGSQLVEQPKPSMGVGEQKGEEHSISSFTSLTEGLSQQIQQQGNTNAGLEGIQLTRDQGPFQGQFMHAESPPHDQQIHPEEPVRSQPVHAGPYQGQAKQEEFYHQPVQGEQLQGQPNNQYLGHPSQPYQFQGQQYHQQEQPQYPWQRMGRENWPDCQVFPGQLGNIPPHDLQYHGMYGQPGMYQPHTVGQEYYPHGHWRDGQNPQDSHPQNTNPAGPQKPNVHKVKEEPSAKQPRKTKPASKARPPKGTPSPDQTPPKTEKEKKKVQTPKKPEKSYVCVKGLNANTGLDTLWLYLENKSGCDVDKSSVLYTSDKTMAVATLLGSPANFQEFKNKCHQKKLEGASVRVCVVPAPVTVVVSSEQHMPSEHEMKKHFQQDKFGWVKVRRIKMTDDGCYRVQFKDNAAFEKVCHSPYPHKIGSASLCVTALYECEFGEVWEDDKHKVCIPDNIVLKHADHHKMELVKKYETIKELLQSKLKPKLAKLKVTDELHVECTMDQKTEGVRRLVRVWDSEVREIWEEFIDVTVQQDEILVTAEVWKDLFGHVKEHTAHKTVHLDFQDHDSDVRLVVVGIETMFSTVTENLYQHKDCIEKAIERKKQIRSVTKEFKSFEIRLLRRLDTLTQVNTLVEDLNVTDNEELGTITYNGVIEDINTAQTIIGDITQQFRIWTIQEDNAMNNDQVRLLQNRQVQNQLKQKFAEHKLLVELDCTAGGLELGTVSASAEQDVTRIINDTVTFSDVPLTDTEKIEVLKTFPWKQQCQQIQEDNSGLVIVSTMMDYGFKVTSTDIIHKDILKQLRTFIGEHAKYEDRYDINDEGRIKFFKKHYSREIKTIKTDLSAMSVSIMMEDKGLALAGTWQGIHQAKDRLNTLEKDIKSKQHDIHRLGIGTIVRPDNADMFCGIENETTTIIMQHETIIQLSGSQGSSDEEEEDLCGTEESNTWGRTGMFGAVPAPQPSPVTLPTRVPAEVTCKNGLKIKLLRGEIGREKADVLVISTSQDLELDKAGAGKSLVKYGGPGLQAELKANHPSKINHGDIITIGPGTLKCKQVFLCNLPEWEKDKNKKPMVVTEVIVECLTKAAKAGYSTVKFVALGTGALKYPPQIVAESMYGAVHRYDAKGTSSVLLVTFVLYSSDRRTISAFEDEEYNQVHPGGQTRSTGLKGPFDTKHGIKVTLVKGLMDSQTVDVITCVTSMNLDMAGGVATAMSKVAGPELLQADCKAKYPSGIEFGDVAAITNGNLRTCKSIYLTSLPGWKNQDGTKRNDVEKLFNKAITTCLQKVAQSGMKSIAFPAIGTGQIGYPRDTVAKLMYDYVVDFAAKNRGTSLTDVRFVLHQKDRETIHSFEKEEQMRLSPSRAYTSGPHQCFYTKGNRLRVSIDTCSIADFQKADVIAATVSDDLDLSKGGAMAAISKKGGITLKAECDIKYPRGIKIGDLAEISPGSLSCKALYLGTLPSHSSGPAAAEKALDKYIQKVLDTASSKGYTSVAFPAVGTGFNNYPHSRAATLCYEAVQHFDKKPSSIKTVYFVILQKDAQSLNAFQREERKRNRLPFGGPSPGSELGAVGGVARRGTFRRVFSKKDEEVSLRPRRRPTRTNELGFLGRRSDKLGSYQDHPVTLASGAGCMSIQGGKTNQFVYGKVTLQVNVENIVKLKDPVEVIVNSTNKDLDFTKGAVSKEIVKMCDPKQLSDECEKLKPEMKRKGMIYTSGCGLSCTAILHIDAQSSLRSWKNTILACLQEADRHGHTSIAFPALGTAGESVQFKPEEIAETLHESLQQFSGSKLTLVRLVIFEQKMLWGMQKVFRDNIQKPSTSVAEDYNVVPGSRATPVADVSRVSLWILGTSDYNIDDAIASIKNLVDRKYTVKTNADTLVCQLKDYEVKEIEKLSKRFLVEIKVNKQARVVEMDGPLEEVNNVSQEVHRLFSHFQMERHKDAEAEFIKEQVQWFYTEIDSQGVLQLSEYPPRTNMELENSRKGNHPTYKFRANDQEYVVNLLTMKEYAKDDPTDTADVVRREKQEGGRFELPADWNEMVDPKEIVRVIPLAASSKTYQDTETLFKNSVLKGFYSSQFPATKLIVHKIERVQNRSLFQQYSMKKSLLEQKNPPGTTNEQLLWHGTGTAAITSINYYGFNRSYCGGDLKKGACWYGAGVYFADDASYSARDWLSGSGPANQKRNVYLCKVLTGVSCPAAKNMKYLPALPNNPGQNYDSAVQPQNKLKEYIIFNDTQAYPEFLINFSAT